NASSLLGRAGTLNLGSTVSDRKYLRMVLRDKPVRRSISRIGIPSRKCQRRITLNNAMSITPMSPDQQPGNDQNMGQFSVKTSAPRGSDLGDIQHSVQKSVNLDAPFSEIAMICSSVNLVCFISGPLWAKSTSNWVRRRGNVIWPPMTP